MYSLFAGHFQPIKSSERSMQINNDPIQCGSSSYDMGRIGLGIDNRMIVSGWHFRLLGAISLHIDSRTYSSRLETRRPDHGRRKSHLSTPSHFLYSLQALVYLSTSIVYRWHTFERSELWNCLDHRCSEWVGQRCGTAISSSWLYTCSVGCGRSK